MRSTAFRTDTPVPADDLTMQLAAEEVLKLSPDDSSAKAAKGLVIPSKWPRLEFNEAAIWGECQGSGSKPYQVQVDKAGPAFRCTCPSRKFPCKHGLAILLLLAQNPAGFSEAQPPAWVSEWLASRKDRAEKQEQKKTQAAEQGETVADAQAAARREAQRVQRMAAGLEDLERWLVDRLRQGLAALPAQAAIWDEMATRMVDAQLPGVAFRLRRAGVDVGKGEAWPSRVLAALGQLQLMVEAFRRIDSLPVAVQADLRAVLGLTLDREAVLAQGERLTDDWLVLGQSNEEDGKLWTRRVWLRAAQSGRYAMLLDYAHGAPRFERSFVTAARVHMTVAYFPGSASLRAIALDDLRAQAEKAAPDSMELDASLDQLSQTVAASPWQLPLPILFSDGTPGKDAQGWYLQTTARRCLRLHLREDDGWQLLAESGGAPLTVFGEWDGESLRPLSCWNTALIWTEGREAA